MNPTTLSKGSAKRGEPMVVSRKEYDMIVSAYAKLKWYEKERDAHNDILQGKVSRGYRTQKELHSALRKLKR